MHCKLIAKTEVNEPAKADPVWTNVSVPAQLMNVRRGSRLLTYLIDHVEAT